MEPHETVRRRRWPRLVGVGVLTGAATVAGAGALGASPPPAVVAPAASSALPSIVPAAVEDDLSALRQRFWGAGYTWGDAVALAQLWGTDELNAKADAGQRLSEGIPLPIAPGTAPDPVAAAVPAEVDAFFAAGYDWDDAVALAGLWRLGEPYDAKVAAGRALLAGEPLPVAP